MKLYTEEQTRYFFECGKNFPLKGQVSFNIAQEGVTPIELPSDEEIADYSLVYRNDNASHIFVFKGAKWVIEQIKQQDKNNP